jgi:phosphoribosyl 1,2-cyclic phosphodiesterase
MEDALEIRFWGVRGSLPSPGPETAMVGGNTSCVEVKGGGSRIILDAGSGLRALGDALVARGEAKDLTILLSHVHWDHVMGLPFFVPLYTAEKPIVIAAGPIGVPILEALERQMMPPLFPVSFDAVRARVRTVDLAADTAFDVGALHVTMLPLVHPDPVIAYRISFGGRSVVYATDTEHSEGTIDARLAAFARQADVLIYDAQYTPEEYRGEVGPPRRGWGHSTFAAGAELARAAEVKTLALFHHDPRRTDDEVGAIVRRAREVFPHTVAAREGLSLRAESVPPWTARDRATEAPHLSG